MRMAVDLVCGVEPPEVKCEALAAQGFMELANYQDDDIWEWIPEKLNELPDEKLLELYAILRKGECGRLD